MTELEIFEKIKNIIKNDLDSESEITIDTSLLQESIMDSMDWISFLARLEEDFGLEISSDDASQYKLAFIGNLISFLKERIK